MQAVVVVTCLCWPLCTSTVCLMISFTLKMLGSIAFYPSLAYNLVRNYVQPQRWQWYNRVDENLVLGAMPFKSMVAELKENENIGGVVCCTEEFETKAAYNAMDQEAWAKEGIKFHHVPMQDFTGSTSRQNLHSAVEFIDGVAKEGKSVYVHCKAGRTRSATVATCYLMAKYNYMPNVAIDIMKRQRHQIILRNAHWRSVNEYRRFLDSQNTKSSESTSS